jgi:predicted DNA-binding transcriptional regulator YafY
MARYERVAEIYRLLSASSEPISLESLCGSLNASTATVKRLVRFLREELMVPVEFNRDQHGYRIDREAKAVRPVVGPAYDFDELSALSTAYDILDQVPPGLFRKEMVALRTRVNQLVTKRNGSGSHIPGGNGNGDGGISTTAVGNGGVVSNGIRDKVRLQLSQRRPLDKQRFNALFTGLEKERRLRIRYSSRTRDGETERVVSPQRLTFYRSNWYLAAWCHVARDLRVFAVDRITQAEVTPIPAHVVPTKTLDARLCSGYGIFDGEANATAVLRFSAEAARWIADEEWHPMQKLDHLPDGSVLLHLPYRHTLELRMDILRYGGDVEVVAPPELRADVAASLSAATALYN